jgi:hypothetical protein
VLYGQTAPPERKEPKQRLGKKEAAQLAAQNPDQGSRLGQLMARRQGTELPN